MAKAAAKAELQATGASQGIAAPEIDTSTLPPGGEPEASAAPDSEPAPVRSAASAPTQPIDRIAKRSYDLLADSVIRALYDMEGYNGFARARAALVVAQRKLGRSWTGMQKAERAAKAAAAEQIETVSAPVDAR